MFIKTESPGKILLTGGYTILDPDNRGLVLACDSCITVETIVSDADSPFISVFSTSTNEKYTVNIDDIFLIENVFIKSSLSTSIELFSLFFANKYNFKLPNIQIDMKITASTDFYIEEGKTGLGSSAALTVALVTNIYLVFVAHYQKSTTISDTDHPLLLLTALLANARAQNKIGSGFDIQAALIGSHVFSKPKINFPTGDSEFESICYLDQIEFISNYLNKINKEIVDDLVDCDVYLLIYSKGSDTRNFVKEVMKEAESRKGEKLFDDDLFGNLANLNNKSCDSAISLFELNDQIRAVIKEVGQVTGQPIEPEEATDIIEEIKKRQFVFACVPGAGGYDGIVVIGDNLSWLAEKWKVLKLKIRREGSVGYVNFG